MSVMERFVIGCLIAFALGAFWAYSTKRAIEETVPWLKELWKERAERRALRPGYRKALYWRAYRVACEVERYGRETSDHQMRLLGFVLVNAIVKVDKTPQAKLEDISWRMGKLREAADAVGSRYDDKWWRDGQDWTARWASEVVGKAATGRTRT